MKVWLRHVDDPDGDLWTLSQDVKRLSDLLAAYNLGLSLVDRHSGQPIELDFQIHLHDGDGPKYDHEHPCPASCNGHSVLYDQFVDCCVCFERRRDEG